jgi:RNA methyltransferase, TrmH family
MITGFSNPLVKRIKRLRHKKFRLQEGAFFIEGLRVVLSAVESGAAIDTLIYSPELLTSQTARQMLADQRDSGITCLEMAAPVFEAVSERDNPTGLAAIVRRRELGLEDLKVGPESILAALVGVSDPGNLGTVLRTLDAVAAGGLILVGQTVDPYHPSAVKASMGALFTIPICQVADEQTALAWAGQQGLQVVATSARAQNVFWQAEYRLPALLLLGSEGEGLAAEVVASADLAVSIPMSGRASSLNLAVAAGLLLYEIRRRGAAGAAPIVGEN